MNTIVKRVIPVAIAIIGIVLCAVLILTKKEQEVQQDPEQESTTETEQLIPESTAEPEVTISEETESIEDNGEGSAIGSAFTTPADLYRLLDAKAANTVAVAVSPELLEGYNLLAGSMDIYDIPEASMQFEEMFESEGYTYLVLTYDGYYYMLGCKLPASPDNVSLSRANADTWPSFRSLYAPAEESTGSSLYDYLTDDAKAKVEELVDPEVVEGLRYAVESLDELGKDREISLSFIDFYYIDDMAYLVLFFDKYYYEFTCTLPATRDSVDLSIVYERDFELR